MQIIFIFKESKTRDSCNNYNCRGLNEWQIKNAQLQKAILCVSRCHCVGMKNLSLTLAKTRSI
jgi:hypothetical protein